MFDFTGQNAFAVRNFALFSSIFRLGKQAKYSFYRPHNLRSLVNQQIVVEPTAVSFQMETQTGTEFTLQKKSEYTQNPVPTLTHTNYHKEHNFPPFKRIRVQKFRRAGLQRNADPNPKPKNPNPDPPL